ncbi:hypothetical protein WA026_013715 [Henosepilachna vigintioctopunctata]|uniref:Uncharacterized protein n=1 Tax=Henosepilachna vigintioctopunctata TaxID=420089 RepID=A0AAW1V0S1_9CUCU
MSTHATLSGNNNNNTANLRQYKLPHMAANMPRCPIYLGQLSGGLLSNLRENSKTGKLILESETRENGYLPYQRCGIELVRALLGESEPEYFY